MQQIIHREATSASGTHLRTEDSVLKSVVMRKPLSFFLYVDHGKFSVGESVGWQMGSDWCCIFFGIREAGNTSIEPGSIIIFSLNLVRIKRISLLHIGDNSIAFMIHIFTWQFSNLMKSDSRPYYNMAQ